MPLPLSTIPSLWATGIRVGITTLPHAPILGLKRLLLPVSYWRSAEFAFAGRELNSPSGARVLDLGSPKDLSLFLALRRNYELVAVDILPDAIAVSEKFAQCQGRAGAGAGLVKSEVQDGRKLPYADSSFDAAYSISVLEHIPDHGDTTAMSELLRVVKPGGKVVVTVPFDLEYRETFLTGRVYDRDSGEKTFFERHYDTTSLQQRLLNLKGAKVQKLELWGEPGISGERILKRLGRARMLISPLEGVMAASLLRDVQSTSARPMAAFFTVVKTS